MAAIIADVDLSDHPDAETIERRLRDALRVHGQQVPPGLTGMSRVMAARAGPRGTRSARVLWLGASAAGRAVQWAWRPSNDDDADERRFLRGMYASLGGLIVIDVLITVAAGRASGWRRLPWVATGLMIWLLTTRLLAIGAIVTIVVRGLKGASSPPESPIA